jgi:hypothetical protein
VGVSLTPRALGDSEVFSLFQPFLEEDFFLFKLGFVHHSLLLNFSPLAVFSLPHGRPGLGVLISLFDLLLDTSCLETSLLGQLLFFVFLLLFELLFKSVQTLSFVLILSFYQGLLPLTIFLLVG